MASREAQVHNNRDSRRRWEKSMV